MDFYKILNISRSASQNEIKVAYRKLALQHHPDRNPASKKVEAEAKFRELTNAYKILSDAASKAEYDRQTSHHSYNRHAQWNPQGTVKKTNYHPNNRPPSRPVRESHFNVKMWNAWHYFDDAIVEDAIKRVHRPEKVRPIYNYNQREARRVAREAWVKAEDEKANAHETAAENLQRKREMRQKTQTKPNSTQSNGNDTNCIIS